MRSIAIILVICLISQFCPAAFARTLDQDERWSNFVSLDEDIMVPVKRQLTLAPGTLVLTNGHKIIAHGKVDIQGAPEEQVIFFAPLIIGDAEVEVIKVRPYNINTQLLKDEFRVFKVQYAILWSVLFASMFLAMSLK
jgi:hypothetical protein